MRTTLVHSRRDSRLRATVVAETPLRYRERGGWTHVRAGSSLAWFGRRLAVVQDDTRAVVLIDPASGRIRTVPLPDGKEGGGQRDADSKRRKLDLEACTRVAIGSRELLLVFGSGSRRRRRVIAALLNPGRPRARLYPAGDFYALLSRETAFTGGDLNLEGALWQGDHIRLVNRGNRSPGSANASCDVDVAALLAWMTGDGAVRAVGPRNVVRYDLGRLDGLPLTFTDVAAGSGKRMLYSAAAEDTADAILDGPVAGSVLGVIGPRGGRWIEIRRRDGSLFPAKVEGICPRQRASSQLWLVTDADDPDVPTRLCDVRLTGRW